MKRLFLLRIATTIPLSFLMIESRHGAGFEQVQGSYSGRKTGNGFEYYQALRDQGIELFVEKLAAGEHDIYYDVKVTHSGVFNSGISVMKCMYRPEIQASSSNFTITVN